MIEKLDWYKLLNINIISIHPAKLTNKRGWMCYHTAPGPSSKVDGIIFIIKAKLCVKVKVEFVDKQISRSAKFKIVALNDELHYVLGSNGKIDRIVTKWIAPIIQRSKDAKSIKLLPTNLESIKQYLAARM